jgi:hypothetical protein
MIRGCCSRAVEGGAKRDKRAGDFGIGVRRAEGIEALGEPRVALAKPGHDMRGAEIGHENLRTGYG